MQARDGADGTGGGRRHLVLVGAGHAHVEVLRAFGEQPPTDTRITLVTRTRVALYSGMLPGALAGHYAPEDLMIPVPPLAAHAGADCRLAEAIALDPAARRLALSTGDSVTYDLLSLDIGSTPDLGGAPAIGDRLVPVKPLDRFLPAWEAAEASHLVRPGARIAVVGGGVAGCEIALAIHHRLAEAGRAPVITLVERGLRLVPALPAAARPRLTRLFAARGIALRTGATGGLDRFDVVVWTTGAAAAPWLAASGLACDARGFVRVDASLRSLSHRDVFAAGDIAAMVESPRPKAGVFPVRQGPVLATNLLRAFDGAPLRRYRPQRAWLTLIATGPRHAIATRNGLTLAGAWVWRWKDRIDRRFLARYREELNP